MLTLIKTTYPNYSIWMLAHLRGYHKNNITQII
ncbi:MAG: hypothetical protein ACI8T1_003024 [Verrucomicrobiales bacterium]|jgi:hypothetical protein